MTNYYQPKDRRHKGYFKSVIHIQMISMLVIGYFLNELLVFFYIFVQLLSTAPDCPCLDLTFIVDASGSIGGADWALTLDFLVGIVNAVNAQLDAATCGDQINVRIIIHYKE